MRRAWLIALLPCLLLLGQSPAASADGWRAGVAKAVITPEQPMWMAGYSSRTRPAEGTLIDLAAKALVIEDPAGRRVLLITLDLIGIHRAESLAIREAIEAKYNLPCAAVALCTSHTHSGPVVGHNLSAMYFLDEAGHKLVADYADKLHVRVLALAGEAIGDLAPASLSWGRGHSSIAVNRRNNPEAEVPALRAGGKLSGPVDHDVPVLAVRDPAGELRAVVFGYACHATVMDFFQWSGDYPGFAQLAIEQAHPGAVALFWAGCGGDQNPLPRRAAELSQQYGDRLARAVDEVLGGVMTPISGELASRYAEAELPFDRLPTTDELKAQAASSDRYEAQRARMLLEQIDSGEPLRSSYPYPVQVWKLGPELLFITLGGEVVVDYALRLKQELGPGRTWVAGYANDVMAYIPSRRVLLEGGYEGGGAMVYYGLPTIWAPDVEEVIVRQVRALASELE